VAEWKQIPGETPIDPSALIDQSLGTRQQLSEAVEQRTTNHLARSDDWIR
jgi:hypothetical protein